jgi:heme/copper-type cytochrome/quinol oxidase subunit 1
MDEGTQGIIILILISVIVALVTHGLLRRFWAASALAAIISTSAFNALATIRQGYLDKFFLVAFLVGGLYAFVISVSIGLVFWLVRRRR